MEWVLLALFLGYSGQCAHEKRQRKWEREERRFQRWQEQELKEFVASLEGLSEEEKAERWKARGVATRAAIVCASAAACCIF